jgi:hypothetical protein
MSENDLIEDSRNINSKITIIRNEMNDAMKSSAQVIAIIALKSLNNFQLISQNITKSFDTLYGLQWHCIVGEMGFDSDSNHINGTFLSFTIGCIQIMLFQTIYQIPQQLKVWEKSFS